MTTINIKGIIYPWTAEEVTWRLNQAGGKEVDVNIGSPGGSVWAGLEIFNALNDYSGFVTTKNTSEASSIASIMMLAGDKITANENSVYMIHNSARRFGGTKEEMKTSIIILNKIDDMMAKIYAAKTGKDLSEIKQKMIAETYFFGNEMKDFGFVDEMIKSKVTVKSEDAKAEAKQAIEDMLAELTDQGISMHEIEKLAACVEKYEPQKGIQNASTDAPLSVGDKTADISGKKKEKHMDINKLKAEHPEVYEAVMQVGLEKERDRVGAFLVAGDKSGDMKTAITAIKDGSEMTMTLQTEFLMAATNRADINDRSEDNNDAGDGANAEEGTEAVDDSDKVLARVKENLGIVGGE